MDCLRLLISWLGWCGASDGWSVGWLVGSMGHVWLVGSCSIALLGLCGALVMWLVGLFVGFVWFVEGLSGLLVLVGVVRLLVSWVDGARWSVVD